MGIFYVVLDFCYAFDYLNSAIRRGTKWTLRDPPWFSVTPDERIVPESPEVRAVPALGNKWIASKGGFMPVLFIEAPPGIRPEKKRVMMQKITEAIEEAYHIGDTLIFLREYPVENVAMDGRIQSENPKILEALKKIGAGA